jgi:glycerophosphoryl diester phosphodiesterase
MQTVLLLLIVGALCMTPTFATEIIAHRGASYDAPENTLAAVKLACAQGANAVEVDVRLSKDGKIVLLHDPDTTRTGGVARKVTQQTLEQLHRQDLGKWGKWHGKGFTEKIPLLEEALDLLPDDRRLFIEIKCGDEILPELGHVLRRCGRPAAQTVIIGFDYATIKAAKATFPELEVNWLVASPGRIKKTARLQQLVEKAWSAKFDGLDLNSRFLISPEFVATLHRLDLKIYTWTVDDPILARRQAESGVDGITTNRPGWLREQLALKS